MEQPQPGLQCTYAAASGTLIDLCDCPCDDLIKDERPSVTIMTLSHVAKSLVVVIVGINMGLR